MHSYYYHDEAGEQQGPVQKEDLLLLIAEKRIASDAAVFREGDSKWRTVRHYPELADTKRKRSIYETDIPDAWREHSASHMQPVLSARTNPPSFGLGLFAAIFFPPVGWLVSIVWLCDPRYRGAGAAIFLISIISAMLAWVILIR